jgi:hypothetical protein
VAVELWCHGDRDGATDLLHQAETAVNAVDDAMLRVWLLREVVHACARIGDTVRAERLTRSVGDRGHRAQLWLSVATAIAADGDTVRAGKILDHVEAVICSMSRPDSRAWAWPELIETAAATNDYDRARRVATRGFAETVGHDVKGINLGVKLRAVLRRGTPL